MDVVFPLLIPGLFPQPEDFVAVRSFATVRCPLTSTAKAKHKHTDAIAPQKFSLEMPPGVSNNRGCRRSCNRSPRGEMYDGFIAVAFTLIGNAEVVGDEFHQ